MRVYYTKEISAAHKLSLPYQSKCLRLHGHNYRVEVFVEGEINAEGMVVDFTRIKEVVMSYDHIYLNDVISQPTVENLILHILERLKKELDVSTMSSIKVRVWEDSESYAEDEWKRDVKDINN